MAKEELPFRKFVDAMNAAAPFDLYRRGMAVADESVSDAPHPYDVFQTRVERVLSRTHLLIEEFAVTRDELMGVTKGLLREPDSQPVLSMLDASTTGLTENEQIMRFLRRFHGIDLDKKDGLSRAENILLNAIEFYEKYVARQGYKVHTSLMHVDKPEGILEIFKIAAGQTSHRKLIPIACALLRIAFVIDLAAKDPVLRRIPVANQQLITLLKRHIKTLKDRSVVYQYGEPDEEVLPLVRFEDRIKLDERIWMKLLHKPKNRAEDVLDGIGTRWTTHRPSDTLRLIYYLFFDPRRAILPAFNIRIQHTKNIYVSASTLSELLGSEDEARKFVEGVSRAFVDPEEITLREVIQRGDNVRSARAYRAISVVFDFLTDFADGTQESIPAELQFLDEETNKRNWGTASHQGYVERQQREVQRRLNRNLATEYDRRTAGGRKGMTK